MQDWICPKCNNTRYEFDVQNKKFITISCKQCGYTELYKGDTTTTMNILDFLSNR